MYTTEASIYMLYNDHGFTGIPPGKDETWSKKALCDTLQKIEEEDGRVTMNAFKVSVVNSKTSTYTSVSGIA